MFKRRRGKTTPPAHAAPTAITVKVVEDTHLFESEDGTTLWCGGYTPVDEDGSFMSISQHHTSDGRCIYCNVAGVSHRSKALQHERFKPSEQIILRPEPTNVYDPNAVAVWDASNTVQAGYVPATLSPQVAEQLRNGKPLGGIVLSEFRRGSESGPRVGLHILLAPPGELLLSVSDAEDQSEQDRDGPEDE